MWHSELSGWVDRGPVPETDLERARELIREAGAEGTEMEFVYSDKDGCWRSEFTTPRAHGIWCLVVEGRNLTGSLKVLPENAEVRKVQAVHD